jgi:hypothetical protein
MKTRSDIRSSRFYLPIMKKRKLKKFIVNKRKSKKLWIPTNDAIMPIPLEMKTWFKSEKHVAKELKPNLVKYRCKFKKKKQKRRRTFNKQKLDDNEIIRSKKIQMFPNDAQRKILILWTDIYRYFYNQTIYYLRQHKGQEGEQYDFAYLRKTVKPILMDKPEIKKWVDESGIPQHTLDNAIQDVVKAFSTCIALIQEGHIKHFQLRYKKATSPRQTLVLERSCFQNNKYSKKELKKLLEEGKDLNNKNTFCPRQMGDYIKTSEDISNINADCRMTYNVNINEFFLFEPQTKQKKFIPNKKGYC